MIFSCPVLLSFPERLVCLCLEMLFLLNLALSAAVAAFARRAARSARSARSMPPQRAARLFFTLRLLPFTLSLLVVVLLCIPSYLRYERNLGGESIGWFCLIVAALGLALCAASAFNGILSLVRLRIVRRRLRLLPIESSTLSATPMCVAARDQTAFPLLALTGIRSPRLLVSRHLLETLSPQQLEVAISHERAHQSSRDNLKRLVLAVTPGALPFMPCLHAIERQWELYVELTADDTAASGRIDRAIALAEALVQVARLRGYEQKIPLASALSAHDLELALRVDRLLAVGPAVSSHSTDRLPPSSCPARQNVFSRARESSLRPFRGSAARWSFALLLPAVAMLPLLGMFHPLYHLLESLLH